MTDISDEQVIELLRNAEQRLKHDAVSKVANVKSVSLKADDAAKPEQVVKQSALSVRQPLQPHEKSQVKDSAGPQWFDLPKTKLTPEFKRDWQLLRMRSLLDPKHQKKALKQNPPEYSQVGEIIAGPTEFYSARLTRKERKGTLLEQVTSGQDSSKFKTKYAGIQKQKASGKKGFYQRLVAQRRKSRS